VPAGGLTQDVGQVHNSSRRRCDQGRGAVHEARSEWTRRWISKVRLPQEETYCGACSRRAQLPF
jgi:hypothetical protein